MAFDFPASPTVGQVYTPAGGPSYIWDGTAWTLTGTSTAFAMVETIVTASATYTKPAGLKYLEVDIMGGGGAGGGVQATSTGQYAGGGGGGAGAFGHSFFDAASIGATVSMTIGAGGVPTVGPGGNGGTTSFGTMSAAGGNGGATGIINSNGSGGAGGVATGCQINGAGAGGTAGAAAGYITESISGGGGSTIWGSGPGILYRTGSSSGVAAVGYGAGGGGAHNNVSQSSKAGSAGAPGLIRLREFF
jgi:hypothetical protein